MQILKTTIARKRERLDGKPAGWSVGVWWDDGTCKFRIGGITWLPGTDELFAPGTRTPSGYWAALFSASDYFWRALRGELSKRLVAKWYGPNPIPAKYRRRPKRGKK